MVYSPLSSSSDGDEVFKSLEVEESYFSRRIQSRMPRSCLHVYAVVVTILLFVSLFSSHWGFWQAQARLFNAREIKTTLGRDETYMMLDHEYDGLWTEDLAGGEKVFVIPNEDGSEWSDDGSPAMIAMYTTPNSIYWHNSC